MEASRYQQPFPPWRVRSNPSRLGSQRNQRRWRNILPLLELEQLLEEEEEVVGLDILGLALLDDSHVVVCAP